MSALEATFTPLPGQIADSLPALIAYVDATQRYQFVNAAYQDWFGFTQAEMRGQSVDDLLGPALAAAMRPHREAVMAGQAARYETSVAHRDGSTRQVEGRYVPDFDAAGRVQGYYVLIIDRSEMVRGQHHELQLKLALEASGMGGWSWDAVSDVLTLSDRAAAIYGVAPGSPMTWRDLQALIHPDDVEWADLEASRSVAGHTIHNVEYRVRRRSDGAEAWVQVRGQGAYDADGQPLSMTGMVSDISAAKRTELALRESEARFRAMADSAPAPVWVTSAQGPVEFVNQAFVDYAGGSRDALLGGGWMKLIHPDDIVGVATARAAARGGTPQPYTFEARFLHHDGAWRCMQANCNPRFDTSGAFQGYVGIAIDLTETRAAEASLRESEQRFRLVAEDAPVMLWMANVDGSTAYVNRALREFWRLEEGDLSFSWAYGLLDEDRPKLQATLGDAVRRRVAFDTEARYRVGAGGDVRLVSCHGEPRRDAEGGYAGMIGVIVDVTDARRAETHQRLLINELNHRVKNTLATVQSIAYQTLRTGVVTSEARELFTSRLLALSAAHNVLTRESWEAAELAAITAEAIRPYIDPEGRRISIEGPQVRVGPTVALAISMALHELATNAAKYGALSGAAGRVTIVWRSEGEAKVALEWRESGGPPVTPPTRRGFGSRLLMQGLAAELGIGARMDFDPAGVRCVFVAPVIP